MEVSAPIAYDHRLERPRHRTQARRVRVERRDDPVCEDQSRAGGHEGSRPSLEERYGSKEGFVRAVDDAARRLVKERFLLQEDAERYVQAAREADALFTRATGNQ